ncbi:MAG: hypothetical protein K0Q50_854 [Vampirovibrio sp.]|jgi:hypothetical protein|nr:hypothetical protein [Vampirovibrio sp.]
MTNPQPPDLFSADCERVQDALFSLTDAEMIAEMNIEADTLSASELNDADRLFLEKHLLTCEECRLYRQGLQHMTQSLSGLEAVGVPAGLEDRIMANIAELAGPEAIEPEVSEQEVAPVATLAAVPTQSRLAWKRYAPLAAAVMVIALALPFLTNPFAPRHHQAGQPVAQRPATTSPTSAIPTPSTGQPAPPHHEATSSPTKLATVPAKSSASTSETLKTATVTRTIANAPQPQTTPRHGAQPASRPSAVQSASTGTETDVTQIASALPQSASQHFSDTYDSASESDVYYDPVSTLVGF